MLTSTKKYKFSGKFRPYQEIVINEAERHFRDGKIHIVAPPGSGKTVLGLELICRLGKPALILSPTVTIRHQWCQRFLEHFSGAENKFISEDIQQPRLLTSVTYQAVYAAYARK